MRPKAVHAAPALSRALARVLNATESREKEREEEHSDNDMEDSTKAAEASGKTQILPKALLVLVAVWKCRNARPKTLMAFIKGM